MKRWWLTWIFVAWAAGAAAAEHFVAADGEPDGDGTLAAPWDLATALAGAPDAGGAARVRPGDVVWVGGGTYRGGFGCALRGAPDKPITFRGRPGERATVDGRPRDERDDGRFVVSGDWLVFWGLEFTCSDPTRVSASGGDAPPDIRRGGITVTGSHNRFINLVVHDTSHGFALAGGPDAGEGGEVSGCIIYYNGWRGPDGGHGHGIHAQNARGVKRLADNIIFGQFGFGIHCHGPAPSVARGFHIEGNVTFHNGWLTKPGERLPGIFVGGTAPLEQVTVQNNFVVGSPLRLGNPAGPLNREVVVRDNHVFGPVGLNYWQRVVFTANRVAHPSALAVIVLTADGTLENFKWDNNTYHKLPDDPGLVRTYRRLQAGVRPETTNHTFERWQELGFDRTSHCHLQMPGGVEVFVRPNRHERGRAHVVVFNSDQADTVAVELANVLAKDQRYRIVSAQNYFGPPVASGVFDGAPVRIPMRPVEPARPVGPPELEPPPTGPGFAVFVVRGDATDR
jgi:hypothetical protein